MRPKDRVALFSFEARPQTQVGFTNEPDDIAHGLQGLRARGGTALYDALVYGLYSFDGVRGQKALIVLSDLIAYQSTSAKDEGDFRRVDVEARGRGEVRAPAGYYP